MVGRPKGHLVPNQHGGRPSWRQGLKSTILVEFDASGSSAIERIAVNRRANELIVQFRGNSKTYVYRDCPFNLIDGIMDEPYSLGKFAAKVKALSSAATLSRFPANSVMFDTTTATTRKVKKSTATTRKVKKFANRSAEWTAVLKSVSCLSLEVLRDLIDQLNSMHQLYAPSKKPKISLPLTIMSSTTMPTPTEQVTMASTIFSFLQYVEDDHSTDDRSDEDYDGAVVHGTSPSSTSLLTHNDSVVQVRYFLMKTMCAKSEKQRKQAVNAQRKKMYVEANEFWVAAFDTINIVVAKTKNWYHYASDTTTSQQNNSQQKQQQQHSPSHAREILDALGVLAHDTKREKDQAVGFLYRRLELLKSKLYPMMAERNTIMKSMGEEKWRSNPAPKNTQSERRKQLKQELQDVETAIHTIEPLCITDEEC